MDTVAPSLLALEACRDVAADSCAACLKPGLTPGFLNHFALWYDMVGLCAATCSSMGRSYDEVDGDVQGL